MIECGFQGARFENLDSVANMASMMLAATKNVDSL